MQNPGQHTYEEILSQPQSWAKTTEYVNQLAAEIQSRWQARPWKQVLLTGCGSTYYLSLAAAAHFRRQTGQAARGVPASELWLSPEANYPAEGDLLLIAVSRSGATTETLNAAQAFQQSGRGELWTITCEAESPLASMGALNIRLPWATEISVAQTRSFASMYLAALGVSTLCGGNRALLQALEPLPELGEKLIKRYGALMDALGSDSKLKRFYFLGSEYRYGLASEVSLKMKEMSLTHSEPFHVLEFRHGPKSMVNKRTLVVGLLSEANVAQEAAVLREMGELGAQTLALAESKEGIQADHVVSFGSGLTEEARSVLCLPPLQLLAYERSLSKGLNPDNPTHLDAVVRLDNV